MRKTRIVHVVANLRDGGAEAIVRGLVSRLAAAPDLDLHVISIYDPRLDADELQALGAPVHAMGRNARRDVRFIPRLIGLMRKLEPDVVHGHIHTGKFVGRMAAIAAGVPNVVFTEHGDEARGMVHWTASRLLNARTTRFIVFTEEERLRYARVERIPLERISVIPNGIAVDPATDILGVRAEIGLRENELAIVVPARLAAQKNQQLAIRALPMLSSTFENRVRLIVAGDGPDRSALETLAAEIAPSQVTFLGYRNDAQRVIAACDVMALPSLWEKMPLIMGEAMLTGVPIVSTPWTGVEAFINDRVSGYLASDWTVESFAAALRRSLENSTQRADIVRNAREVGMRRFDMTRMVDAHAQLYRELATRKRARRTPLSVLSEMRR